MFIIGFNNLLLDIFIIDFNDFFINIFNIFNKFFIKTKNFIKKFIMYFFITINISRRIHFNMCQKNAIAYAYVILLLVLLFNFVLL
jgi:hypothetical protein